jgi:hypothetical protein
MLAIISASTPLPQRLVEMVLSRPAIGFSEVAALAGLGLYLVLGGNWHRIDSAILSSL